MLSGRALQQRQVYAPGPDARIKRHRQGFVPEHARPEVDELDVDGILAFAERILPCAADLWVQASLEQRQWFQQLFLPDGIAFDGNGFVRTDATAPAFSTCGRLRAEMKVWWPRFVPDGPMTLVEEPFTR